MALANSNTARLDTGARRAEDSRADQSQRWVTVLPDFIQIDRVVHGVKMRITVPMEAYVGIGVRILDTSFEIRLVHRDADLSVTLECVDDEALAKSLWQLWATHLDRPMLESGMGSQAVADTLRPQQPRRRCMTAIDKRRPRRALRRKPGNHENLGLIRSSEDEIISYE